MNYKPWGRLVLHTLFVHKILDISFTWYTANQKNLVLDDEFHQFGAKKVGNFSNKTLIKNKGFVSCMGIFCPLLKIAEFGSYAIEFWRTQLPTWLYEILKCQDFIWKVIFWSLVCRCRFGSLLDLVILWFGFWVFGFVWSWFWILDFFFFFFDNSGVRPAFTHLD